jgi:hypothetical protein
MNAIARITLSMILSDYCRSGTVIKGDRPTFATQDLQRAIQRSRTPSLPEGLLFRSCPRTKSAVRQTASWPKLDCGIRRSARVICFRGDVRRVQPGGGRDTCRERLWLMSSTQPDHGKPLSRIRDWACVTDEEILDMSFPEGTDMPPEELSSVYHEYVRRGLQPPTLEKPARARSSNRRGRHLLLRCLLVHFVVATVCILMLSLLTVLLYGEISFQNRASAIVVPAVAAILVIVPAVVSISYCVRLTAGFHPDPEGYTRCGVCGHILRGLRRPRCPECGTPL